MKLSRRDFFIRAAAGAGGLFVAEVVRRVWPGIGPGHWDKSLPPEDTHFLLPGNYPARDHLVLEALVRDEITMDEILKRSLQYYFYQEALEMDR